MVACTFKPRKSGGWDRIKNLNNLIDNNIKKNFGITDIYNKKKIYKKLKKLLKIII